MPLLDMFTLVKYLQQQDDVGLAQNILVGCVCCHDGKISPRSNFAFIAK